MKRAALIGTLATLLLGTAATASAGVEVGGVAGVHTFSETDALGVNVGVKQSQKNSSLFALRLGIYFTPMFGVELEGGLVPTEPRSITADVYDATYRGHFIAQFRTEKEKAELIPFVLVGGGVMDILSSSNELYIHKDRDGMVYAGAGLKYRANQDWGVRLDARALLVPSSKASSATDTKGGLTVDVEVLLAVYKEFGRKHTKVEAKKEEPKKGNDDPDGDGIVGTADKCPDQAEDKDGFEDDNGCPDPDNDGDGILDANDKCMGEAEDKDSFKDDDGCPELDNDEDGIPDATDKCVDKPETKNGFEDDDGCPDEIPVALAAFTGAIQGITFNPGSTVLAASSNKVLDKAVAVLTEFKQIKLEIQGHTDDQAPGKGGKFKDNTELSQGRAEAVKAYFVKKGIEEGRLTAKGYGESKPSVDPAGLKGKALNDARAKNRRVEFQLIQDAAAAPATPPAPPAAPDAPKS